jgi:hypothetical protein
MMKKIVICIFLVVIFSPGLLSGEGEMVISDQNNISEIKITGTVDKSEAKNLLQYSSSSGPFDIFSGLSFSYDGIRDEDNVRDILENNSQNLDYESMSVDVSETNNSIIYDVVYKNITDDPDNDIIVLEKREDNLYFQQDIGGLIPFPTQVLNDYDINMSYRVDMPRNHNVQSHNGNRLVNSNTVVWNNVSPNSRLTVVSRYPQDYTIFIGIILFVVLILAIPVIFFLKTR